VKREYNGYKELLEGVGLLGILNDYFDLFDDKLYEKEG
jgi:hypothetical protein